MLFHQHKTLAPWGFYDILVIDKSTIKIYTALHI